MLLILIFSLRNLWLTFFAFNYCLKTDCYPLKSHQRPKKLFKCAAEEADSQQLQTKITVMMLSVFPIKVKWEHGYEAAQMTSVCSRSDPTDLIACIIWRTERLRSSGFFFTVQPQRSFLSRHYYKDTGVFSLTRHKCMWTKISTFSKRFAFTNTKIAHIFKCDVTTGGTIQQFHGSVPRQGTLRE